MSDLAVLAEIDDELLQVLRARDNAADELFRWLFAVDSFEGRIDVLLQRRAALMDDGR